MTDKQEQVQLDFSNFAQNLFNTTEPRAPNSCIIDIDFQDESNTLDFLQDLFQAGVKIKFPNNKSFTIKDFELIRDYIRAIGYETILQAYEKDSETDEIHRVNLTFKPLVRD
jgi:hypothetical protein